jgi:alkylation response protein AidB-like acyl-CoA dehydrogenase
MASAAQSAANCLGAAIRAAEIANKHPAERVQFGRPIRDFQAIEFMLADMGVEIMATKSLSIGLHAAGSVASSQTFLLFYRL